MTFCPFRLFIASIYHTWLMKFTILDGMLAQAFMMIRQFQETGWLFPDCLVAGSMPLMWLLTRWRPELMRFVFQLYNREIPFRSKLHRIHFILKWVWYETFHQRCNPTSGTIERCRDSWIRLTVMIEYALDFDIWGILSERSPVLTLRFSLKIKYFT